MASPKYRRKKTRKPPDDYCLRSKASMLWYEFMILPGNFFSMIEFRIDVIYCSTAIRLGFSLTQS